MIDFHALGEISTLEEKGISLCHAAIYFTDFHVNKFPFNWTHFSSFVFKNWKFVYPSILHIFSFSWQRRRNKTVKFWQQVVLLLHSSNEITKRSLYCKSFIFSRSLFARIFPQPDEKIAERFHVIFLLNVNANMSYFSKQQDELNLWIFWLASLILIHNLHRWVNACNFSSNVLKRMMEKSWNYQNFSEIFQLLFYSEKNRVKLRISDFWKLKRFRYLFFNRKNFKINLALKRETESYNFSNESTFPASQQLYVVSFLKRKLVLLKYSSLKLRTY